MKGHFATKKSVGLHRCQERIYLQCSNHTDRSLDRLLKLVLVRLQQFLQVRQTTKRKQSLEMRKIAMVLKHDWQIRRTFSKVQIHSKKKHVKDTYISLRVGNVLIKGMYKHPTDREQDLLNTLDRAPPLLCRVVAAGVVTRHMQNRDLDRSIRRD